MARKRKDNKKWRSRPSRKKSHRKKKATQKPSQICRSNSKPNRPTKPSQQNRRKINKKKKHSSDPSISLETQSTEQIFDTRIIHDFLSESENKPFCPHSHTRNMISIPVTPTCLKLGFLEQRAVARIHCYMSILIIRGHQSAMKGQVVYCQADITDNIGDLLPFPKCYEFMAVIQQKPPNENNEIRSTVRYSVSAIQIMKALQFLIQNHSGYLNKQVVPLKKIEEMFECRQDDVAPIRVIDSYAYNNCTTSAPIILGANEDFFGPIRTLKAGEDPIWKIQSGMEESTFPWIYPTGEGGELDTKRPIPLTLRDYSKLRLMSADKRWQSDSIWTFRAMNLIQRDDLCTAVNYHVKKQFKKDRLCYNIYPYRPFQLHLNLVLKVLRPLNPVIGCTSCGL
ncbi:unnamed protein product [Adineta steineri]|uniref:DUF6570 domain-containing protein n=1 Tax=Adineta steineri TaxID=433720 RepID=A0A815LDE3_9BILA|nr:unnamed protein product [Adineta steineri]CAF3759497.1 unnamed protein product [Adineta steineri]